METKYKLMVLTVFLLGILVGIGISFVAIIIGINSLGHTISSVNVTLAINESKIIDFMNESIIQGNIPKSMSYDGISQDKLNSYCKYKGYDRGDLESKWEANSTDIVCSNNKGMANYHYTKSDYNEWISFGIG